MPVTPRQIEDYLVWSDTPFFKSMELTSPEIWLVMFDRNTSVTIELIEEGTGILFRCGVPIDIDLLVPPRRHSVLEAALARNSELLEGRYVKLDQLAFESVLFVEDEEEPWEIGRMLHLVSQEIRYSTPRLQRIAHRNNSNAETEKAAESLADDLWDLLGKDDSEDKPTD